MNPYQILGVSTSSSFEEVKKQYKLLVKQAHPDLGGDPKYFKEVKEAFEYFKKHKETLLVSGESYIGSSVPKGFPTHRSVFNVELK